MSVADEQELLKRYLGIYPRMIVTGISVTIQQAKEIIRRTDRLFGSLTTNDYPYLVQVARRLHIPLWEDYDRQLHMNKDYVAYQAHLDELREQGGEPYYAALQGEHYEAYCASCRRHHEDHQRWLDAWGYVRTEYVHNDWLDSQFIYGHHGWCHPDGRIGHIDRVGKGQIAEEIYQDWCLLADAFPSLEAGVTLVCEGLYEGEAESPQVGFLISSGAVLIVDPVEVDIHTGHPPATRGEPTARYKSDLKEQETGDNMALLHTLSQLVGVTEASHSIPWSWIEEWSAR